MSELKIEQKRLLKKIVIGNFDSEGNDIPIVITDYIYQDKESKIKSYLTPSEANRIITHLAQQLQSVGERVDILEK